MTNEEKVLLEQYVSFRRMEFNKGMEYVNFLLNSYDFMNPLFGTEGFVKNNLVIIDMCPDGDGVYFSGAVSVDKNDIHENRSITGHIYEEKNNLIIDMEVYRLGLDEDDKTREYSFTEMFTRNKDGETFKRYSSYRSVNGMNSHLDKKYVMNPKYMEEFIASKTEGMKL